MKQRIEDLRMNQRSILAIGAAAIVCAGALVLPVTASAAPDGLRVSAGSASDVTDSGGRVWNADTGFQGGNVYNAKASTVISGTSDQWLYRKARMGMSGYLLNVPAAGSYSVTLNFVELQYSGRGKRVFDVRAEGATAIDNLDVYRSAGRYVAHDVTFPVAVTDGTLNLEFVASAGTPAVSGITVESVSTPTPTQSATASPSPSPSSSSGAWPTVESTGPRYASVTSSGSLSSSSAGQVIERTTVTGRLTVRHDNVTVRDVRVNGTGTYMIQVVEKADGSCPVNVRFEYVEVDGALAAENDIPLYSPQCGYTFDHGYIHNVGRSSRVVNNTTISNSYIFSDRTGDSGAHRGGVGNNGGSNNALINNVIRCQGTGCSAALPMYGDFAPVNGYLIQHNLLATTGSYCSYGGSLDSKPYPDGSNIRFIDNHFSTEYFSTCGRYGTVSGFEGGVRGNEFTGNVWHETGSPVSAP